MGSLELLDGFVEVNDAVQKREDLSAECGNIAHGPVMSVEHGEQCVHPSRVDQSPCHERQKRDLEAVGA